MAPIPTKLWQSSVLHKTETFCFHQSAVQPLISKMFSLLFCIKPERSLELFSSLLVFCTSRTFIICAVPCNVFCSRVYFQQSKTCLTDHPIQHYCYISIFCTFIGHLLPLLPLWIFFVFIFIYSMGSSSFHLRHLKKVFVPVNFL